MRQPEIFGHDDHLPMPPCYCWEQVACSGVGSRHPIKRQDKEEDYSPHHSFVPHNNFLFHFERQNADKIQTIKHNCNFGSFAKSEVEFSDCRKKHRKTPAQNTGNAFSFGMSVRLAKEMT